MAADGQLNSVEHIVVLMLENRSFDHMLGFLYAGSGNRTPSGQAFDGLTGTESNADSRGNPVQVFRVTPETTNAYYMPLADPDEGFLATNQQLFGTRTAAAGAAAANSGFVASFTDALSWEPTAAPDLHPLPGAQPSSVMGIFTPEALPVLSALARGFAVCDRWFASAPTETMPNRAFALAGTSQGRLTDHDKSYTCPSIFASLTAHQVSWMVYGYNSAPLTQLDFPDTRSAPAANFGKFKDFTAAAAAGTLPGFSFLEPDFGASGNDQHPAHNLAAGEQLIHDVYRACRDGAGWDKTLLIITYDEHGGCYDHVPPPSGATPPDSTPGELADFDFTRFGVRVPTVLISPLIPAGTVFRGPADGPPLDHTSVLATIEQRWNIPPLTARDKAAPTVAAVLTGTAARTDDPLADVTPPAVTAVAGAPTATAALAAPTHLQLIHAAMAADLPIAPARDIPAGTDMGKLASSADYARFIDARLAAWHRQGGTAGPAPAASRQVPAGP